MKLSTLFQTCFLLIYLMGAGNIPKVKAQIINGPWIDTLYRETLSGGLWPSNFLRFNLDGQYGPNPPFGENAWAVTTGPTDPGNYYITHPYFYPTSIRNNRWFVLPPITLGDKAYELIWKSRGTGDGSIGNSGIKIFVCQNCPNISMGNVESVFITKIYDLQGEIGQSNPGPFFYQNRSVPLNNFRNKTIRIAFQNADSALGTIRLKDFIIRSKPLYDLAANDIIGPGYRCNLKSNETIRVAITNQGGTVASGFVVSLFKNGTLQEAKTYNGNLGADKSDTLLFANVNMQTPGPYRFRVKIDYLADTLGFNDTLSRNYVHQAPFNLSTAGWKDEFQTFDPTLYKILDLDQDGATYGWNKSRYPNQEKGEMWYQLYQANNTGGETNDWLMGGCLVVEKDSSYQIGLDWLLKYWQNQGMVYRLYIGYEPRVDSMTRLLASPIRQGRTRGHIEYIPFTAPRSGTLFVGLKSYTGGGDINQSLFSKIQVNKKRNFDLALNWFYKPGDSTFTCAGAGQKITFVVQNLGKRAFINPVFEVAVIKPDGSGSFFPYTYSGTLAPGQRQRITVDSLLDFTLPGSYKLEIIHQSLLDEEQVNDTIRKSHLIYAPKPATFVDQFINTQQLFLPGWWISTSDHYLGFQNLEQTFYGGSSIKRELLAVSNVYVGLQSYSVMQVDLKFASTATGNFLTPGDTLDFLASVNCGPFIRLRRVGPGIQMPTGFQPFFVDLASLNLQPTDRVNFMFRATFAALSQGLNYTVSYDNLRIVSVAPYDAAIQNPAWYPYSKVSAKHRPPFTPGFKVVNAGFQILSPVTNRCTISPAGYNETINTGIGMNATQSQAIQFPSFTPLLPDSFTIKYSVQTIASQPDLVPENNQAERSFILGDSTLARHYGPSTRRLGFAGNGSRGMLGQVFTLQTEDTLTSISLYVDTLTAFTRLKPVLYACNPTTGVPNNFVLDSNFVTTMINVNRQRSWQTISLRRAADQNRGVGLNPGKYFIGLIQKQGFMSLGYNSLTAEKRTVYQRNSAATGNAWTLVDTVGQVLLEANFGPKLVVGNREQLSGNPAGIRIYPNPASDAIFVETNGPAESDDRIMIYNSLGQMVISQKMEASKMLIPVAVLPKGLYRVRVANLCSGFIK